MAKGVGFVINDIYAYLAVAGDGDEGIVGFGGTPLIAADLTRLHETRPIAEAIAKQTGITIRLVRFTTRTELDVIEP